MNQSRSLVTAYYMILFSVATLVGLGVVMTVSAGTISALTAQASPYKQGLSQGGYALVGLVVGLAFVFIRGRLWLWAAWLSFAVTVGLQVLVLFMGETHGGNKAWLRIGPVVFQPSEFLKFALALWLGSVLAHKSEVLRSWGELTYPALLGAGLATGLVLAGSDAGTAAVIGLLALGALVVAGVPWSKLVTIVGAMGVAAAVVVMTSEQRLSRFTAVLNPGASQGHLHENWQTSLAKWSLAEGWLFDPAHQPFRLREGHSYLHFNGLAARFAPQFTA